MIVRIYWVHAFLPPNRVRALSVDLLTSVCKRLTSLHTHRFVSTVMFQCFSLCFFHPILCSFYHILVSILGKKIFHDHRFLEEYFLIFFVSFISSIIGSWIGRKCVKRLESKAYHPTSFAIGHPWRRRIGQFNQGDHCWWWCHSTHPQITHRQEGWTRITKLIIMTPIQTSRKNIIRIIQLQKNHLIIAFKTTVFHLLIR